MKKIQRYKRDLDVSYTLGAALTFELVKCRPERVTRVFLSSSADLTDGMVKLKDLCDKNHIEVETNDKAFNILSPKGNCFVIGEFEKTSFNLEKSSHIVLVNPSDAGNLGTIVRTAAGFGINNIAIIKDAVDFYNPAVIRASMGAAFHVHVEYFDKIEDYISNFPENERYAFMLSASIPLGDVAAAEPFSLIFGNEAAGLPDYFAEFCTPVVIKHTNKIDSLNLPIAAGIAMYEFTKKLGLPF
jgi:TrmH family RNA methyltransferase